MSEEKKELKEEDISKVNGGDIEGCYYYCYSCMQNFPGSSDTVKCPHCGSDKITIFNED